ncbi:MAG: hypothetical protein WBP79_04790 [Candidatus Acidiferrales bacterium]
MTDASSPSEKSEKGDDIGLTSLFDLQDRALSHNFRVSKWVQGASTILARSVALNLSILGAMQFAAEKQTAIRRFTVDALSHIVVAARLGLWGALTESQSVLRGGIESCAQLFYVVAEQRYESTIFEGRRRFKQLDFKKVVGELDEIGRYLKMRHDRISSRASHSTAARFRQTEYKLGDVAYDRLGCALNALSAEYSLSDCIFPSRIVGDSLHMAYIQDQLEFSWREGLEDLARVHRAFVGQLLAEKPQLEHEER